TLTQMYNVLEKLRTNAELDEDDKCIKDEGLILILKELHEKLDRLVFQAYDWPETLTDEQILEKLVALNRERVAEERRGHVRWLRPDYQIPRFGKDVDKMAAKEEGAQIAADLGLPEPGIRKLSFPTNAVEQTAAVFAALAAAAGPVSAAHIAGDFRKTKTLEQTISTVLSSLSRLGHVSTKDGKTFEIKRVA
ncbi:MAG: class I SAM-dependent DNA methyltransferase, partial [Pseudolabrys sp.]